MIDIEIDGKKLQAEEGSMIIEAADTAGIYIPRFCYHKKLSIAANCRMCLVEVEKAPKSLPACATPVTAGMKVYTQSEKAIFSQKAVMEFLLINHPLDCPICDQGGECELQDLAMGYGKGLSRYTEGKRSVKDKDLGPLVASDMTRCIQCTRCVRFGEEVAGMRELGATGRGEKMEIGTYVQHAMRSELSGNVIDLCPVGALTSKPFRFTARAWEMRQDESVAPHDCLGSNIYIHTRGEEYSKVRHVMRVVPCDNEAINETWISDRDRYSYEGINNSHRVTTPLIKREGQWEEVDWATALSLGADRLKNVIQQSGAEQIGALASPSATLEELYLLQKIMRGMGSQNIDHRIRQCDFSDQKVAPPYPSLGMSIADLENLDGVLLIGSDVRREQPLANNRIRKVADNVGSVMCINPIDYDYNFHFSDKLIVDSSMITTELGKIIAALEKKNQQKDIQTDSPSQENKHEKIEVVMAEKLLNSERPAVLLGPHAINHPEATMIQILARRIAELTNAAFGCFSEGANSAGAWLAGAIPHRGAAGREIANPGLDARAMFEQKLQAYLLLNVDPELDCSCPAAAVAALKAADTVIVLSSFRGGVLEEYADIILPLSTFAEISGTYVNIEGKWQAAKAVSPPQGDSRPGWKVLRVLGNLLELKDFNYTTAEEVRNELKTLVDVMPQATEIPWDDAVKIPHKRANNHLHRIAQWPMYRIDNLVRHAPSLQATITRDVATIRVNKKVAESLDLKDDDRVAAVQGESRVILPLRIDDRVANHQVLIPAGLDVTAGFGDSFGQIELYKV